MTKSKCPYQVYERECDCETYCKDKMKMRDEVLCGRKFLSNRFFLVRLDTEVEDDN